MYRLWQSGMPLVGGSAVNGMSLTVMTPATDQAANTSEPAFETLGECADPLVPAMSAYPIKEMFESFRFEPSVIAHARNAP